jgi:ABC-type sugar transport system substrate-binding protein
MKNKKGLIAALLALAVAVLACSFQMPQPASTITPEPTAVSMAGWQKFTGRGTEIWLPENYTGGDLSKNLDTIVSGLRNLGPDFESIANMIEQNPDIFVIWVFDSKVDANTLPTSVNIARQKVQSAVTVDAYLEALDQQLPDAFIVTDKKKVQLGSHDAGRALVEMELNGKNGIELVYVVRDLDMLWTVTYATDRSEFEQRLPVFEQSAATFQVTP